MHSHLWTMVEAESWLGTGCFCNRLTNLYLCNNPWRYHQDECIHAEILIEMTSGKWTCMSAAEEETKGRNLPKQARSEGGCTKILEKQRTNQQFGEVSESQAGFSYHNQILCLMYFNLLLNYVFQYKMCSYMVLNPNVFCVQQKHFQCFQRGLLVVYKALAND